MVDMTAEEERYEREKVEDLAAYEEYLLTGKAIDNKTVVSWFGELVGGESMPPPRIN